MNSEAGVGPPIPYTPLPRRSIDIHGVLTQVDDDVLLIRVGIWRRVVFLVWAGTICGFCAPFLFALHSSLTIENYRLPSGIVPFAWASVAIVIGMLVLAVGVFTLSPIRLDRRNGTVGRGGWVPGWWQRELDDVLAIQICRGKSDIMNGERGSSSKIYLNHQLNLVFDDSLPTRRNLCENRDRQWVVLTARQLSDFLGKPLVNYLGDTPGTLDNANAEASRVIAAHRNRSTITPTILCLASAAGLLLTSCGCPSNSSPNQQQQARTLSHWITVEPASKASSSKLSVKDANALTAQLPFFSDLVRERFHSLTLESDEGAATVDISATEASCLRFLRDTIGAEMKAGRFLDSADSEEAAEVIVIDAALAEKLFPDSDPIGGSLTIGPQTLTVIGVITQNHSQGSGGAALDAYVPRESLTNLTSEVSDHSPDRLDRIRVRVDRLEHIDDAKALIQRILSKLHPNGEVAVQ